MENFSKLSFEECCKIPIERKFAIVFSFIQIGVLKCYNGEGKEVTVSNVRKTYNFGNSEIQYAIQCRLSRFFNECVKEEVITVSETSLLFDKAARELSNRYNPEKIFVSSFPDGLTFFVVVDSDNRKLRVAMLF